jgi:hypothetical protein
MTERPVGVIALTAIVASKISYLGPVLAADTGEQDSWCRVQLLTANILLHGSHDH